MNKVVLDRSQLLGFRIDGDTAQGAKVGGKIGEKIGNKAGVKR
jgi:hypothetical protein